jgi:hypothetical protein
VSVGADIANERSYVFLTTLHGDGAKTLAIPQGQKSRSLGFETKKADETAGP